jgi:uncharacterized protein YhfF
MYTPDMTTDAARTFWRAYLDTLPPGAPERGAPYLVEAFGDNPALADELIALVLAGRKTATCSALWEWEADGDPLPAVGTLTVFTDGAGVPLCVAETVEVKVLPMDRVTADFARDEGEGDLSLEYWRAAHERYFKRALPRIGRTFTPDMPLVCERFRVVHR